MLDALVGERQADSGRLSQYPRRDGDLCSGLLPWPAMGAWRISAPIVLPPVAALKGSRVGLPIRNYAQRDP